MGSSPSKNNSVTEQNNSNQGQTQSNSSSRGGANQSSAQGAAGSNPTAARNQGASQRGENRSNEMSRRGEASGSRSQNQPGTSSSTSQEVRVENDEFVFETFHHKSGRSYVCMFYGGQRYYLDSWDSQEWKAFPSKWYAEGSLIRDDGKGSVTGTNSSDIDVQSGFTLSDSQDDREGFFNHPTRGKIPTYMVEEKRNVMYFYDDQVGLWVKTPCAWEAKADFMKPIIAELKAAIPSWQDDTDIVAALRQSGYDPDDAIATYITVGMNDPLVIAGSKGTSNKQAETIKTQAEGLRQLELKLKERDSKIANLESKLAESEKKCKELELQLQKTGETLNSVKADKKNTDFQFIGVQREKTKLLREKTELMGGSLKGKGQTQGTTASGKAGAKGGKAPASPEPIQVAAEPCNEKHITKETELMIKAANENVKKMDKQQNNLKDFVVKELETLKNMLKQLAESYQQLRGSESNLGAEIEEVRALYRKEMLQRKLLYNELQELRGNIRVFCRIKPDKSSCLTVSEDSISLVNVHGKKITFDFDKVYQQKATQSEIFENTKAVITSAVDGYNVCIIAYGQTGSGKTFTMMGPEKDPGVNLRAVQELFKISKEREKVSVKISANMLEVYNEQVKDLLRDPKDKEPKQINIRIVGKNVTVENAIEVDINSADDVKKMIKRGEENRHVAQTNMNTNSSRSHLLLKINVEITDKVTGGRTRGSLTLVDLAGSEKIAKSGAEGQTLVEAAAINKSLSSLGQVFSALRSKSVHVPYRNSKLTQLLQPSLGGDAKACVFVNCSPLDSNSQETLSTLEFGQNARQVELGKATKNILPGQN